MYGRRSKLPIQVYYGLLSHQSSVYWKYKILFKSFEHLFWLVFSPPLSLSVSCAQHFSLSFLRVFLSISISFSKRKVVLRYENLNAWNCVSLSAGLSLYQHKYIHLYKILLLYFFITMFTIYYIPVFSIRTWAKMEKQRKIIIIIIGHISIGFSQIIYSWNIEIISE